MLIPNSFTSSENCHRNSYLVTEIPENPHEPWHFWVEDEEADSGTCAEINPPPPAPSESFSRLEVTA